MSILKPFSMWVCTDADALQFYRFREVDKDKGYTSTYYWREFDRNRAPFLHKLLASNIEAIPTEEFLLIWEDSEFWVMDILYPDSIKRGQISECMEAYYSMDEIIEFIKNKDWLIITECIFEQTNELY